MMISGLGERTGPHGPLVFVPHRMFFSWLVLDVQVAVFVLLTMAVLNCVTVWVGGAVLYKRSFLVKK